MKIAVISDSHDHLENIEKAVEISNRSDTAMLLHCGDICSPFVIGKLAAYQGPVHIVFGNNDGDRFMIGEVAGRFPNVTVHGEIGEIDTEFGKVCLTHRPRFGAGLAATGRYRVVFSGHTHMKKREEVAGALHINPGEIMGLQNEPGFTLFDLESLEDEYIRLDGGKE